MEEQILSPMVGSVVHLPLAAGSAVRAGQTVVVLESMKMEHPVVAPYDGTLAALLVAAGEGVRKGQPLAVVAAGAAPTTAVEESGPEERTDLAEVRRRQELTRDGSRPDAVAKRRARGQRTARENLEALCDPGTFVEYGALVIAAQETRRPREELIAQTPADGLVTGLAEIHGRHCVVLAYDATVLAGTQGARNHQKIDRMLDLAHEMRAPVVLFAEGGGGRPGDTDIPVVASLDVPSFHSFARLRGRVPVVGVVSGRCFAGNAALVGCCDVVIATEGATLGMGGPAMIEGGGLGVFAPDEVGPVDVLAAVGVVDVVVADETAAAAVARDVLGYLGPPRDTWTAPDQTRLRDLVPENRVRVYDVRSVVATLADEGSVTELRPDFGVGVVTALVRIEGRSYGLLANNPAHLGGAIDAEASTKAADFLELCDRHGLAVVSLCDTPGFMVGPESERTGMVRHAGRLFTVGATLSVPVCLVVLRKAYGLGAMAMAAGGMKVTRASVSWPSGEFGAMGLEGAVRLGFRKELEAVADPAARQELFDAMVQEAYERGKALSAAALFEIDDVIDPADTRRWVTATLG